MLVTNLANSSLILASASVLAQIPKSTDGQHSFYAHGIDRVEPSACVVFLMPATRSQGKSGPDTRSTPDCKTRHTWVFHCFFRFFCCN